jgi:squalene-hopene/tetraprenyl-beta-curcumene cyclase
LGISHKVLAEKAIPIQSKELGLLSRAWGMSSLPWRLLRRFLREEECGDLLGDFAALIFLLGDEFNHIEVAEMKLASYVPRLLKPRNQDSTQKRKQTVPAPPQAPRIRLPEAPLFAMQQLEQAIVGAREYILSRQSPEGYWVFDLEADATIPSEYILLQRFLGREVPLELKTRLGNYLRRRQLQDGGWPLYEGGASNISATVKAYFALKLLGDSTDASHMVKARQLILDRGGATKVNVFTRITLALFGQIPWHTTPAMPAEIMLLPKWFFFHLHKVSYWSRTVIVPLLILYAKRPVCDLQPEEGVRELFLESPDTLRHLDIFETRNLRKNIFILIDRILKRTEHLMPSSLRRKSVRLAESWTLEHMAGEGGIGAIFPAMANALMALKVLGYPQDHPDFVRGLKAVEDLLITHGDEAYCQPCLSPIWDTCLGLLALFAADLAPEHEAVSRAVDWLFKQQIFVPGDWSYWARDLEPGGWAFQFENAFYPDVDDTPVVLMALLRAGAHRDGEYRERIAKGVNWVIGMQSSDGGWGAFDIDNNRLYLNDIPFADHGALLDPSTSDLTARCITLLSLLGYERDFPPMAKALEFLRKEQEPCGAWFGRWGVNYMYGTCSVLMALRQLGEDMQQPYIRKAVEWLRSCQNPDNGWGETCHTYNNPELAGRGCSTPSQTAWALLGLMSAGEVKSSAVQRGIHYLLNTQNPDGGWDENLYTGTGFPGVFYLRYHGYSQYFPLWALGLYRRLRTGKNGNKERVKTKDLLNLRVSALRRR